jgi:hypothetical protein
MEKVLGEKIPRESLVERVAFHFKEVFEKEWEEKRLEDLISQGLSFFRHSRENGNPEPKE